MLFKGKPDFKSIWEGDLSLEKIKWGKIISKEYNLPEKENKLRKVYWNNHVRKFPDDYDGNLLFLHKFYLKNQKLLLDVGEIRFSTILYMFSEEIKINSGLGMLGVQCIIYSPDHRFILIGKRSKDTPYYPEINTLPGGMLEKKDILISPKEALMREIDEEVQLPIKNKKNLICILKGWNGVSVNFIIEAELSDDYYFNSDEVIFAGKDEWSNNLRWIPLVELKNYSKNQLLDGLIYFQNKVNNKIED